MAEDLSQYVDRDPDGRPRLRPGLMTLPPMRSPSRPAKRQTTTAGTSPAGVELKATEPKRQTTGDRFAVLNAFVDCTLADLTRSEIAVWLTLYRDTRAGTVRNSQANIARRAGLTVRGVQKALVKLTSRGLVRVIFKGGLNRGPSRYRVEPLTNRGS